MKGQGCFSVLVCGKDMTNCWPLVSCRPWDTGQQTPFGDHWVLYTLFCSCASLSSKEWEKALRFLFHISDSVNLGSACGSIFCKVGANTDFGASHAVFNPVGLGWSLRMWEIPRWCCWCGFRYCPLRITAAKKLTFSKINQRSYSVYIRKRCTILTTI